MKTVWKWVLGILAVLVVLTIVIGLPMLAMWSGYATGSGLIRTNDGFGPMMGGRIVGMHGYGGGFMGLGMLLALIIPFGLLFLTIYGAVRLALRDHQPTKACGNCGKPAQADWKTCPHCGKKL